MAHTVSRISCRQAVRGRRRRHRRSRMICLQVERGGRRTDWRRYHWRVRSSRLGSQFRQPTIVIVHPAVFDRTFRPTTQSLAMMVHDLVLLVLRVCPADPGSPRRNIEGKSPLQGKDIRSEGRRRGMLVASSSLLTQSRDPTSNLSWIMHQRCSTGLADLWQICYAPCPY